MPWACEEIRSLRLPAARSDEEFTLHRAALEWGLDEPILIESAAEIKSRPDWRDNLEPFEHQVRNLITFCRRAPVALLADDVGLGKTISAGLILSELMVRDRVRRTLVIGPKILGEQWKEELSQKFGIKARVAHGKSLRDALSDQTPVVVTTYQSARNHLRHIEADAFEMLILDEAHKIRNLYGTNKAPAMAVRVHEALEKRLFRFVLMLTATPMQNRLWDLYSLIDCLTVARGHRNPLGAREEFAGKYLRDSQGLKGLQPGRKDEFRHVLGDYMVRTRRGDANLPFPTRQVRPMPVTATPQEQSLRAIVESFYAGLNRLQQISIAQALMSSPAALIDQIKNMVRNGNLPVEAETHALNAVKGLVRSAKAERLLTLLQELRARQPENWRLVVFTTRKATQQAIGKILERVGATHGFIRGDDPRGNQEAIRRFRAEPPEIHVVVSTDAGAEGVNLQAANFLVNYDLPWNPMVVEQRIGRVQRLGSRHAQVVVCNLYVQGSIEDLVVARLMEKLQTAAEALGDVEAILAAAGDWNQDEPAEALEKTIEDLVRRSLLGKDVTADAERVRQNIERGRQVLADNQGEIEATLGPLGDMHRTGPTLPKLTRVSPSVPLQDFVLRAFRAEGAEISEEPNRAFAVRAPGRARELITFDERAASPTQPAIFLGNAPRLYQPGKRDFERLVQQWMDRAGHRLRDLRAQTALLGEKVGRTWSASVPGSTFRGVRLEAMRGRFQGSLVCRVKAANGVDRYEKLLQIRVGPTGITMPLEGPASGNWLASEVSPEELFPNLKGLIGPAVAADGDVGEFCRFYETRRQEQGAKAGADERKRKKINDDFSTRVFAEVVALEGASYDAGEISVTVALEDGTEYGAVIEVVPATGQVLREPQRLPCTVTNRSYPEPFLATCAVSGRRVLKHLLAVSQESGRMGLSEFVRQCPVTGKQVLVNELQQSALTGKTAVASLFRVSPVANRVGLAEDFVRCPVTGTDVLADELVRSQVSARMFRRDQLARSAVCGVIGHASEFLTCSLTGGCLLPEEAGHSEVSNHIARKDLLCRCELTGKLALPTEVETCAISGRRVLKNRLLKSEASGVFVLPQYAVRSLLSRRLCTQKEAVYCYELDGFVLPEEAGTCRLTGLAFARRFLNNQSEFASLRSLLDGATPGEDGSDLIPWLKRIDPKVFDSLKSVRQAVSSTGALRPVCGESRTLLGLRVRHLGLILRDRKGLHILGRWVMGKIQNGHWIADGGR
jgi:superfamily II DNA or RNA helicase